MPQFLKETTDDDEDPNRDHDASQKGKVAPDQVKAQPVVKSTKTRAAKRYAKKGGE